MANASAVYVLLVCLCLRVSVALPAYDDELPDLDKELYVRQLAEWLADQSPAALNELFSCPPCRPCFYGGREPATERHPYAKRNSELINSLLSLPKTMNDAGK